MIGAPLSTAGDQVSTTLSCVRLLIVGRPVASGAATTTTSAYSLRAVAGLLIIVVFGGLPTLVEGQPMWAALVGLIGVIVGFVMLAIAITNIIRISKARRGR